MPKYPKIDSQTKFLSCSMRGCKGFAKTAAGFVRHMQRKHGITVDRTAVAARQLAAILYATKEDL